MRTFRRNAILMSALTAAFAAGGAAVSVALEETEKFVVTGALRVTHVITEQVCDFDTLDQLEDYLAAVADRHDWFRHDQPAAAPLTDNAEDIAAAGNLIDNTAAQVDSLAATFPAVHVDIDVNQLRADVADVAAAPAIEAQASNAAEQPAADPAAQ